MQLEAENSRSRNSSSSPEIKRPGRLGAKQPVDGCRSSYLSFFSFISMCGRLQGSLKFLLKESGRIFATSAGQVGGLKDADQKTRGKPVLD